jgi:hypothetical protein
MFFLCILRILADLPKLNYLRLKGLKDLMDNKRLKMIKDKLANPRKL